MVIPATGKHEYDDGKVTKEPSCTASGVKTYTCKTCDKTKTETIKKLGHSLGEWVLILAPSTEDAGLERAECTKCDYYEERTVEKLEAAYYITVDEGNGKVFLVGVMKDGKYTLSNPEKIGYNFAGWVDANGKTADLSKIGANITVYASFTATAHSYTSKVTTAATCTKAGVKTFTCSKCNHSYTEAIAATGHTPVTDKAVAATCTTAGKTEGSHCSVCNAVIKAQDTVPARESS
jgi:uncharacterized repeat protein (TIGR02543 family)